MKRNLLIWTILIICGIVPQRLPDLRKERVYFWADRNNSGRLTIKYINIMSIKDDTLDVSVEDFESLLNDYYDGEELQNAFPMQQS